MADLYVQELENKVAQYEAIMSRCLQCKKELPIPKASSVTVSSRQSRSIRTEQQPTAEVPPSALPSSSNQQVSKSPFSSFARTSKHLHSAARTELQASNSQQGPPAASSAARYNQPRQNPDTRVSTLRNALKSSSSNPVTDVAPPSGQPPTRSPGSQRVSIRPSSLALATAGGRQAHTGELVALELPQYNKPSPRKPGGRPPEARRHAEWMRTADIMLEEVPTGRHWRDKISSMDSSVIAAVATDATPVPHKYVFRSKDDEQKELTRLVRKFAERHSEGRVIFQHFILVCLCKVLSSQGIPESDIIETLQICISDTGKRTITRYLKGVTWANSLMSALFFTDWGYRAVDLIAIWNRSVSTYGTFSVAPDSRQRFMTELAQRKYFDGYQEVPNRKHDTIPWIVKKELGGEVPYASICKALGYSEEFFEETRHLHSSNSPSPERNAGDDVDDVDSTSRSRSFHSALQSTINASSPRQSISADKTPSSPSTGTPYLTEASQLHRQLLEDDDSDDESGRATPTGQSLASRGTRRMIPDRTAKPLEDSDVMRRRRPLYEDTEPGEHMPSTSMGESAPDSQSAKRPLPDSPISGLQSDNTRRRRRHVRETPSREETDSP